MRITSLGLFLFVLAPATAVAQDNPILSRAAAEDQAARRGPGPIEHDDERLSAVFQPLAADGARTQPLESLLKQFPEAVRMSKKRGSPWIEVVESATLAVLSEAKDVSDQDQPSLRQSRPANSGSDHDGYN